jgi:Lrp/AsnC family leucine-responsive transcriptional regulator
MARIVHKISLAWIVPMEPIDDFDRQILDIVQLDCQMKAEAIGDLVGLSPSAVQRRLKRLRDTPV